MPECAINDCHRKRQARGWCSAHYTRWLRTGDPLGSAIPDHPAVPGETWRTLPGYEGYYEVSDRGRVRSVNRTITSVTGRTLRLKGKILRRSTDPDGRHMVALARHGETRTGFVHRLVMLAFVGPRPPGLEVCHGNGDCSDDRLSNLRYDTKRNNALDAVRHGTHNNATKTHCPAKHLLAAPNLVPLPPHLKTRRCLACHNARSNVNYAKRVGRPYDFRALADKHYARIMTAA